jgi:hypothetical protein
MESSVTLEGTPDDFFGHDIQIAPSGSIALINAGSLDSSSEYDCVKKCQMSIAVDMRSEIVTFCGNGETNVR